MARLEQLKIDGMYYPLCAKGIQPNLESLINQIEEKGYQVMKVEKTQTITSWFQKCKQHYLIEKLGQSINQDKLKDWLLYARQREVVLCALKMAAIVGTILMLINHGEELLFTQLTTLDWIQIGLTYLVPYSVSTYSSVETIKRHHEQQ